MGSTKDNTTSPQYQQVADYPVQQLLTQTSMKLCSKCASIKRPAFSDFSVFHLWIEDIIFSLNGCYQIDKNSAETSSLRQSSTAYKMFSELLAIKAYCYTFCITLAHLCYPVVLGILLLASQRDVHHGLGMCTPVPYQTWGVYLLPSPSPPHMCDDGWFLQQTVILCNYMTIVWLILS